MQRKPGYPVANCNIKMPDSVPVVVDTTIYEEDSERRRLQLINFGHTQWGFNNWSWSVTKQDLDFVDFASGRYAAGVVAFVSITVKSLDIHRENIGYATATAPMKGSAVYQARKGAVTNALRETLVSFGGAVATELLALLEATRPELANSTAPHAPDPAAELENNQNVANKMLTEPKNIKKDVNPVVNPVRTPHLVNPVLKNVVPPNVVPPPVAKTHPMPPAPPPPLPASRLRAAPPPRPAAAPAAAAPAESLEGMSSEEEARAERKRRQRLKQEEFRLKQQMKGADGSAAADKQDLHKSTFDKLLMAIPSQDIVIEETGATNAHEGKRKSPEPGHLAKRRASVVSKLDILTD